MDSQTDLESQAIVWNLLFGVVNSMLLKCAIRLDIVGAIQRLGGTVTLPDLGAALSVPTTNLSNLRRIMRYLVHLRLVSTTVQSETNDVAYVLAPASKLLMNGEEKSLSPLVNFLLGEDVMGIMHHMELGLAGDPTVAVYEKVKGESIFAHSSRCPEDNEIFNNAMASMTRMTGPLVAKACRPVFERIGSVVDVGGGTGTMARAIATEFPHVKCTVYDLPHVVKASPAWPEIDFVGGDMFVSVPQADAIVLTSILHDWSDERCLLILKKCKEAIPNDHRGTLIIVDVVIDARDEHDQMYDARLAMDMIMMAYPGGKERTEMEWRGLLSAAGFTQCTIKPIRNLQHVIEANP